MGERPAPVPAAVGLLALLQLSSVALPVGGFSYSQGLETAIDDGIVTDAASAGRWITSVLMHVQGRYDAPLWWRLRAAWDSGAADDFARWNEDYLATRETRELKAETVQMGRSLIALAPSLRLGCAPDIATLSWPAAHAWASSALAIGPRDALTGFLFTWAENQVTGALKAVPLGQSAGQALLFELGALIPPLVEKAIRCPDADLSSNAPHFAIIAGRHESQYSRLFRS